MSKNLFNRYVWMVDTIRRRGRITRDELAARWAESALNDTGQPLTRRTMFNYRRAIEEVFGLTIECDRATYEYYIANEDERSQAVTDWLLNTASVNEALSNARDVSGLIFLENAPSAREWLVPVIDALRQKQRIQFDYHNYNRSRPSKGVQLEPYFLKYFKQRWYVVGRHVQENKLKTYALDRVSALVHRQESFEMPATFDPDTYFKDAFGIVVPPTEPRRIALRTDHRTAQYLRALPLHPSQNEVVHDKFSIFYYRMLVTEDLVSELLSYGPRITVLEPPELRASMIAMHRQALAQYTEDKS